MYKRQTKGTPDGLREATWDEALDLVAGKLRDTWKADKSRLAFWGSGQQPICLLYTSWGFVFTRGVHHDGVVFHELDVVGVQQMMGCRHERRVEADHVGEMCIRDRFCAGSSTWAFSFFMGPPRVEQEPG